MLLEATGLQTFYGASQALFGVDLAVGEGEVVALMGRNGMGKTTTI
ncbi:MAG: ATP-binding cassette domain-containing protein, partial [Nitratireductor sp.]